HRKWSRAEATPPAPALRAGSGRASPPRGHDVRERGPGRGRPVHPVRARACANPCKVLSIVAIGASHAPGPGGADQADLSTALANAGPAMRGERCNLWVLALIQ